MSNKNKSNNNFEKTNSTFNSDKNNNVILDMIRKYKRYAIALGAMICIVLILFFAVGKGGLLIGRISSSGNAATFAENKNKDIEKLIKGYYEAYADGNIKALSSYAVPISKNESDYIRLFADYIKSYKIIKIYTQQGIDENSCLASVEMEIEFNDTKTKAPGLDFFYITGVKTGNLYINNLYSQFNLRTSEYITEPQIDDCINKFENRREVIDLQEKVQKKYEEAIISDEELDVLVNSTISDAILEWMNSVVLLQNQVPPAVIIGDYTDDDNDGDGDDTGDDTSSEEPIVIDPELEVIEYAITTDDVNVRSGPSKEKKAVGKAVAGAKVTVLAIDVWGEWSYVQVNDDLKGFIRNDFLVTQDNDYTITGLQGYPEKDQLVAVSEEVILKNGMSGYPQDITKLQAGTQVTIIAVYRNGYAKVMANGRTGYLPIDKLSY
ncbi:MAG: SH3 domain-containing protein [Lachnospiraceae bacterium]|nr:SH3 domain-containing protein [Lachnospiraceae bacterium]